MSNKRAYGSTTPWTAKDYHWFCNCIIPAWDGVECRRCRRKPENKMAARVERSDTPLR
jgi:hypothetical protein